MSLITVCWKYTSCFPPDTFNLKKYITLSCFSVFVRQHKSAESWESTWLIQHIKSFQSLRGDCRTTMREFRSWFHSKTQGHCVELNDATSCHHSMSALFLSTSLETLSDHQRDKSSVNFPGWWFTHRSLIPKIGPGWILVIIPITGLNLGDFLRYEIPLWKMSF